MSTATRSCRTYTILTSGIIDTASATCPTDWPVMPAASRTPSETTAFAMASATFIAATPRFSGNEVGGAGDGERLEERVLAHAVEDRRDSAWNDLFRRRYEIRFAIEDRVVGAMGSDDFRFFFGADGADHFRAEVLRPLHEQQSYSACSGM